VTRIVLAIAMISAAGLPLRGSNPPSGDPLAWPPLTTESKPWTRWWWLGSAVDAPNLTRLLEQYHDAGIGGVEICPIYGAKGYESRYPRFPLAAVDERPGRHDAGGKNLGMGVDLTTGTGWPFGGRQVDAEHASRESRPQILRRRRRGELSTEAARREAPVSPGRLRRRQAAARHSAGQIVDRPPGKWRVYAVLISSRFKR
jgi:hypothetical protein